MPSAVCFRTKERAAPTRNINLTDHLDRFVERQASSGQYSNASEIVRDALRLSAHVLGRDKRQAASQLWGRIPEGELDLRTRLAKWTTALRGGWLRPARPTFESPGGPLIGTLEGHTDSVNTVAITPDGQHAVSASDDRTLRIWDLASGATLRTLEGHTNSVSAVAITPDGQRAVSASDDGTIMSMRCCESSFTSLPS